MTSGAECLIVFFLVQYTVLYNTESCAKIVCNIQCITTFLKVSKVISALALLLQAFFLMKALLYNLLMYKSNTIRILPCLLNLSLYVCVSIINLFT